MRFLTIICSLAGALAAVLGLLLLGSAVVDLLVSSDEDFPGRG
jgi:hypothetical protein